MVFVYITSFIFLIICIIFGFTLYRLYKTTVNALVTNVNCESQQCELTLSYSINNIMVTKTMKTTNRNFKKDDTIRIYINPKDLNSPKFVSTFIYIILYIVVGASIFGFLISLFFIFYTPNSMIVVPSLYK